MGKGILLGEDGDIIIRNGSMVVGDTEIQETAIIIAMNQGEQKFSPVLGVNLVQMLKSKASTVDIEQRVRVHLEKDGKDYNKLKHSIKTTKK